MISLLRVLVAKSGQGPTSTATSSSTYPSVVSQTNQVAGQTSAQDVLSLHPEVSDLIEEHSEDPTPASHPLGEVRLDFRDSSSNFDIASNVGDNVDDLKMRYDETPQVRTCSETDSDQLNLKHPIPAFPETALITSAFERIESVLRNHQYGKLSTPYGIPAGAKSTNIFWSRKIGRYRCHDGQVHFRYSELCHYTSPGLSQH